jgi:4,5:9,10-diseco-3-hydroxy-5,9,17-trioxoandrosta-1(10),2-diene-4-oate hydrolase
MEDRYVQVNGYNIRYWMKGEGPPVVLIHGIGGSADYWGYNIGPLSQKQRIYALDLLGFGRSEKPAISYTLPFMAEFIAHFMDTLDLERASFVGWSLGGIISMEFALDFPDRLNKLVLVGPAGLGRELNLFLRLMTIPILGEVIYGPTRWGTRNTLRLLFYDPKFVTEELVELAFELAKLPGARRTFLTVLRYGVDLGGLKKELLEPLLKRIPRIKAPTLIIWGKEDRIIPVAHAQVGKDLIRGSKLHIFERCGHAPHIERAEEFNALVSSFLSPSSATTL